jgi:hypothetical protein
LIVQAQITAATVQDVELSMPLLHDLQARELTPEERLLDSGYVSGEVLAAHAELGIELVGPLKQEGGWQRQTGYGLSAFQVDWDKQQVRCPQGHLSQNWCPGRHNRGEEVIRVSFSAVTCQACPVKALCTKREKHKGRILTLSPQRVHEARERRRRNKPALPFSSAMRCGPGSKAAFRKGCAAMGCAAHAIADSPRRNCRPKPSRRPSTWCASVRCCNGRSWDSRLGPSVLCLLWHACDRSWRHDVRTKFPSRVINWL